MKNKKLDFAAMYQWIEEFSSKVTYRSQVVLFDRLFDRFVTAEGIHYSAGYISEIFRGDENLPI